VTLAQIAVDELAISGARTEMVERLKQLATLALSHARNSPAQ
jgi:hypothetical protein